MRRESGLVAPPLLYSRLGFAGIYTIGSFIHVLVVVAIVLFLAGLFRRRVLE